MADKLFVYDSLNTKESQFGVWGEVKEGVVMTAFDYELRLDPETQSTYAEYSMGETIAGKLYDVTKEQLEQADVHMGGGYKRVTVKGTDGKDQGHLFIRGDGKTAPATVAKVVRRGKKGKK